MNRFFIHIIPTALILLISCVKEDHKHAGQEEIFNDVYQSFNRYYGNFDTRPDFDSIYVSKQVQLQTEMSDGEFFSFLSGFIGSLQDPHVFR